MAQKKVLLLAKMDPPPERETAWNKWYSKTHVDARLATPGFLSVRRFTKVEGIPKDTTVSGEAKYLALYDVENIDVLKGGPYTELVKKEQARGPDSFEVNVFKLPTFSRAIYRPIEPTNDKYKIPACPYVFVVGHEVPRNRVKEFNAWYNTEHIPALLGVPGFLSVRRFHLVEKEIPPIVERGGTAPTFLTIWDIKTERAFDTPEFKKASGSPWTLWVWSWYTRKMCMLYRRIYPED